MDKGVDGPKVGLSGLMTLSHTLTPYQVVQHYTRLLGYE